MESSFALSCGSSTDPVVEIAGSGKLILNRLAIPPGSTCTVYSEKEYSYLLYSTISSLCSSESNSTVPVIENRGNKRN